MQKYIFIVNGKPRAGKDTFAELLNTMVPTMKYSSVNKVKAIAMECGWDGGKTEKDRKFLSDLKRLTTEYNDMSFNAVANKVETFRKNNIHKVMLIDIREPKEIMRAKKAFDAYTVLIENDRVENVTSNESDAGIYNCRYDFIVPNNGTLEDFKGAIRGLLSELYI